MKEDMFGNCIECGGGCRCTWCGGWGEEAPFRKCHLCGGSGTCKYCRHLWKNVKKFNLGKKEV